MRHLPLRSISIFDFRCLEGTTKIPLDAPIVLIHGPNGAGKTSVLSAMELALTGEIASMRRHDDRYTAHLPTHGQDFATVDIEIHEADGTVVRPGRMTVGGSRIKGSPALRPEARQFYAERCYLDQVSLGRLLEIYQYREGPQESALGKFANELLGLDQLDALRDGLRDATDKRRLRNLSEHYSSAEDNAKRSANTLEDLTRELDSVETDHTRLCSELEGVVTTLGHDVSEAGSEENLRRIKRLLSDEPIEEARLMAQRLSRSLTELGGRIKALTSMPATDRLDEAQTAVDRAATAYEQWRQQYEAPIASLRADVASAGLEVDDEFEVVLDNEVARINALLERHDSSLDRSRQAGQEVADLKSTLEGVQAQVSRAESRAGSLASALAALREHVSQEVCPVCDRDYSEIASGHLEDHLDKKIRQLTDQGHQIRDLIEQRESVASRLREAERDQAEAQARVLSDEHAAAITDRRSTVVTFRMRIDSLSDAIRSGAALRRSEQQAERNLADLQAAEREHETIRTALAQHAATLDLPLPDREESLQQAWTRLNESATSNESQIALKETAYNKARDILDDVVETRRRINNLKSTLADASSAKLLWQERVDEMARRHEVARAVHKAARDTRVAIVQRVFTESLNTVWRDVFSRLAPREPFVPAFGIPSSSRTALELHLETVHPSGETGGPPSLMLSTGNLNTAALSLFIALHLAVSPLLPCLVFDDPVQSMDEVHVAQFAGLLRILSKRLDRQVVIAVHERELFEYLALELSPACKGDELITIELGPSSEHTTDDGVTRIAWSRDAAVAV